MEYSVLQTRILQSAHRVANAEFVALVPLLIDEVVNELQMLFTTLAPFQQTATFLLAAGTTRGEADLIPTPPDGAGWTLVSGDADADFSRWKDGWLYDENGVKLYQLKYYSKDRFERLILSTDTSIFYEDPGLIRMRGDVPVTGAPVAATFYANELLVYPQITDQGIGKTLRLDYYATMLYDGKADAFEDELLRKAWPVLLYGALVKSEPYLGSEIRIDKWIGLYQSAKQDFMNHYFGDDANGAT